MGTGERWMPLKWLVITAFAGALLGGCGENCQSTCTKIYDPAECNIQIGGVAATELIRDCETDCEAALTNTGPMGDYNPFVRRDPLNPKDITNEKQAAAWMDCVASATCEELEPGFGLCEPI